MKIDMQDAVRVVQNKAAESEAYLRQLHIWLGLGSAGGAISMVSLAASLPDPAYVFHFLQPSLWCFLMGVVAAGGSLLFLSLRADAMGSHVAAAHNRDELHQAIRAMPYMISSPPRIADEVNQKRNAMIELSDKEHERAERDWTRRQWHSYAWVASLVISAFGFVGGFAWPLVQVSFLGGSLLPG